MQEMQNQGNAGAAANPQQNSVQGFSTANNGLIYDQQGNIVTDPDDIAAAQKALKGNYINSPYVPYNNALANANPQMADWVAQQNNAQNVAGLQRNINRNIAGQDVSTIPTAQLPFGDNTDANITATLHPWANPTALKPEVQAEGSLKTGLVGQTGGNDAATAYNTSLYNAGQSQFALQQQQQSQRIAAAQQELDEKNVKNVAPLQYAHALSEWTAANNRQPTENEKNGIIADVQLTQAKSEQANANINAATAATQAHTANTAANFFANEQGLLQHTQRLGDVANDYNAGIIGQRGTGIPFASSVGLNGVSELPGVNPTYASMMKLANAKMGGAMGGDGMTAPSGLQLGLPTRSNTIGVGSYTPGSSTQTGEDYSKYGISSDLINDAKNYEPLSSNPDILINPKTQRAVYKPTGEDITSQVNSNPALVHQIAQELKDKDDKEQSDNEKVLKAQHTIEMNNFKKKQDAIAAQKPYGGLVGIGRDASTAIGDTLIGNLASTLGSKTSTWHPMNDISNWSNNLYNRAKTGLIGQ